jgi:two-component system sensor histidine kinase KdpD
LRGIAAACAVVAVASGLAWTTLGRQHLADVVMVYLLGVVVVSMRFGYGPSLFAAVLSVLGLDFFFIPPYLRFDVAEPRHLVTFGVMFFVAVIISGLTKRVRDQARATAELSDEANRARLQVETEQLRNALLSSLSHDLRTPLAVVTGAASTLLNDRIGADVRRELTDTILQEADRLNRLVQNLLDITRLEAGALRVRKQWLPFEEVIGTALSRLESVLGDRPVVTTLPSEITLVPIDSVLIEQVLVNLLDNAAKYTPPATEIRITARVDANFLEVEVADGGPGVPSGQEALVFDKFFRGRSNKGGSGLGLTICRGIVGAHGGRIWVAPSKGGGASFRFTLPIEGPRPDFDPGTDADAPAQSPSAASRASS